MSDTTSFAVHAGAANSALHHGRSRSVSPTPHSQLPIGRVRCLIPRWWFPRIIQVAVRAAATVSPSSALMAPICK